MRTKAHEPRLSSSSDAGSPIVRSFWEPNGARLELASVLTGAGGSLEIVSDGVEEVGVGGAKRVGVG